MTIRFATLVEASRHGNLKLADVARWLADGMPDADRSLAGSVQY